MAYKNLQHYRHTVHRYLDAIWCATINKRKSRTTMYQWLSKQMNLDVADTHVSMFNREQCKQAIKILRPMYIQLFGHDLVYNKKKEKLQMYYSSKTFSVISKVKFNNATGVVEKYFPLKITVYCRSKILSADGYVLDMSILEKALRNILHNKCLNDVLECQPTLERLAKYIYEQVIPCYKVTISNDKFEEATFEEMVD